MCIDTRPLSILTCNSHREFASSAVCGKQSFSIRCIIALFLPRFHGLTYLQSMFNVLAGNSRGNLQMRLSFGVYLRFLLFTSQGHLLPFKAQIFYRYLDMWHIVMSHDPLPLSLSPPFVQKTVMGFNEIIRSY